MSQRAEGRRLDDSRVGPVVVEPVTDVADLHVAVAAAAFPAAAAAAATLRPPPVAPAAAWVPRPVPPGVGVVTGPAGKHDRWFLRGGPVVPFGALPEGGALTVDLVLLAARIGVAGLAAGDAVPRLGDADVGAAPELLLWPAAHAHGAVGAAAPVVA